MSIRAQRILACLMTVIGLVYAGVSLYGVLHHSAIGLETDPSGKVLRVAPHGAAERAGIVAGDHVDFARTDEAARFYLTRSDREPEGTVVTLPIGHNGVSHVYRLVAGTPSGDPISPWKRPISALLIITAGVLVFLRPQRATWAFLGYALVSTVSLDNLYLPYPWAIGAADVMPRTWLIVRQHEIDCKRSIEGRVQLTWLAQAFAHALIPLDTPRAVLHRSTWTQSDSTGLALAQAVCSQGPHRLFAR